MLQATYLELLGRSVLSSRLPCCYPYILGDGSFLRYKLRLLSWRGDFRARCDSIKMRGSNFIEICCALLTSLEKLLRSVGLL